ncbi:MAG TPA: phosphate ABC transporter permease subunit PstC [Desertimonas sp.]|nr:phosphate ABC transporter permease subunit PstC [Desertimonas sp.]
MTAVTTPTPKPVMLQTSRGRRFRDRLARVVLICAALTTFAITVLIIGTLAFDAWDFIRQVTEAEPGLGWQLVLVVLAAFGIAAGVGWLIARSGGGDTARLGLGLRVLSFLGVIALGLTIVGGWKMLDRLGTEITQVGWFPRRGLFDLSTIIVGTFMIVVIAMAVAVPLGLGAAIYLSEYASPRVRRFVKPILEILAGIPSVVLAYFAITFINPNIVVRFFNPPDRAFSMLAAGIAVGVLTVPIIASVTEDALRAVPLSLREASFGLGAQRAQTTFRVVFPAGVSGIVAALILGISRAIGETMVVAIAAGAVGGALFHISPLAPGQTMTAAMAGLSFGSDQVAGDAAAFQSLFFIGALLFMMTLLLNVLGDKLVNRVREAY